MRYTPRLSCSRPTTTPWHERMCEVLAEEVRGARVVRIPETDHVIPLRRPDEFNSVVMAFLGEVL